VSHPAIDSQGIARESTKPDQRTTVGKHGFFGSAEVAMTAFSGTGSKLGGTTTGNMDTAATATALTDRRDKARLAALARLEQQQQQQQHSSNDDKSS
jgi:hypothetical protein